MKIITIQTKHTTYQIGIHPLGFLLHLYYGAKTEQNMSDLLQYYDRGFAGNPYDAGGRPGNACTRPRQQWLIPRKGWRHCPTFIMR